MSKTLVAVNILDTVKAEIYGSHCQEWFRLGRSSPDDFILFYPNRFSIDNARNQAANFALRNECNYLYFIDDDIILTPKTYQSLQEALTTADAHIAQALTFIRGYPFNPMMFQKSKTVNASGHYQLDFYTDYETNISQNGLVAADAVGFSCVLIDIENTIKKINPPYFVTSALTTEDIYFCLKLKDKLGDLVKFVVDTKVPTGHLLSPEAVSVHNITEIQEHYKVKSNPKDRGEEYKERCLKQFQ